MTSLPIKKSLEALLQTACPTISICYPGVWKVKDKGLYVKSTSELTPPPVRIPIGSDYKKAYSMALRCAKVYKAFIKEGIYHPETEIVLYNANKGNLALMVLMPKLNTEDDRASFEKASELIYKFKLCLDGDMFLYFNWGCDEKGNSYAHDLHLGTCYDEILEIADKRGIE